MPFTGSSYEKDVTPFVDNSNHSVQIYFRTYMEMQVPYAGTKGERKKWTSTHISFRKKKRKIKRFFFCHNCHKSGKDNEGFVQVFAAQNDHLLILHEGFGTITSGGSSNHTSKQGMCQNQCKNITTANEGQGERVSVSLYAIFVYIPALTPLLLLRIEPLPTFRIPIVSDISSMLYARRWIWRMLCSASLTEWACTTHSTWQWFKVQHQLTWVFSVPSVTPTPFSPPALLLLHSTGRLSDLFPCFLGLGLLFSWHEQGPLTLFSFCLTQIGAHRTT